MTYIPYTFEIIQISGDKSDQRRVGYEAPEPYSLQRVCTDIAAAF